MKTTIDGEFEAQRALLVDADGNVLLDANGVKVQGSVAHDAVDAGNPNKIGGVAVENVSTVSDVAVGDRVNGSFTRKGVQFATPFVNLAGGADGMSNNVLSVLDETDSEQTARFLAFQMLKAPDTSMDQFRSAGDSGPGLGAANVAPIGGDISLRASAIAGEANGTSTAVDNIGWVKSFIGRLGVSAVPSGGSPTLDVYLQTQLPDDSWQDIAHFAQVAGVISSENVAWGPIQGNVNGTQAEGAAVTVDNYFQRQDASLAASTVRLMPLGDSMRVKWVFAAGGSTGDYTFSVDIAAHS